jgi:trans-aconitate methyltransferase
VGTKLSGDETVLDAGCGSGHVTKRLLERLPQGRVIAVDASEEMVDRARRTLTERATVLRCDLTELIGRMFAEPLCAHPPGQSGWSSTRRGTALDFALPQSGYG